MNNTIPQIRLSGDKIKLIAIIFMIIDHVSFGLLYVYMNIHYMDILPQTYTKLNNIYEIGRGIGRIAFPIFCFFLVEGFLRTKNIKKYAIRLFVFSLISEIPFDLGQYRVLFNWEHQNVMFSLFLGLMMMITLKYVIDRIVGLSAGVRMLCIICTVTVFGQIALLMHADYDYRGIILIALLYLLRTNKQLQLMTGAAFCSIKTGAPIAFLFLLLYDPAEKPKHKYFFYFFYPVHLLIIYFLSLLL